MKLNVVLKSFVAIAAFGAASVASAATVYCPGNSAYTDVGTGYMNTTTTTVPVAGTDTPTGWNSYIYSTNFVNNKDCYWTDGNLDNIPGWTEFNTASSQFNYSNYALKNKTEDGVTNPSVFNWSFTTDTTNKQTTGTWTLAGFDLTQPLYIGFHFGNGQDAPDSFIVAINSLSGAFTFQNDNGKGLGLSNLYIFGTRCTDGNGCEDQEVPEPTSLALLGAGLAGLALVRRRRRT